MRGGIYFSYLIWNTCRTSGEWSLLKFIVLLSPSLLNSSHETLKWYPGYRLALYRDENYIPNYKIWYCPNNKSCVQEVPTQGNEPWPLLTKTAKQLIRTLKQVSAPETRRLLLPSAPGLAAEMSFQHISLAWAGDGCLSPSSNTDLATSIQRCRRGTRKAVFHLHIFTCFTPQCSNSTRTSSGRQVHSRHWWRN